MATGEKPGSSTADGSAGGPPGGTVGVDGRFGPGTGPKAKTKDDFWKTSPGWFNNGLE